MQVMLFLVLILCSLGSSSQLPYTKFASADLPGSDVFDHNHLPSPSDRKKLYQRNFGMIAGLQKGNSTAIELGAEAHWRKISVLNKPHVIGATTNLEYNFANHVVGYKAGMWKKTGRINLTYGGNIGYYNNFKGGSRMGLGPLVGFRLLGFHLVNGLTILTKDKSSNTENPVNVNTLHMSLRYYFPVENKFTWDRKTMKKKRERKREREKKKEERQREREDGEKKGLRKLFDFGADGDKKPEEKELKDDEKKGLKKIFNWRAADKDKQSEKEQKSGGKKGFRKLFDVKKDKE
jgi:hypothetical protein